MALTKEIVVDLIEVREDGQMQVREATRVLEDGVILSSSFHRKVIDVGDDVTNEPDLVRDVAQNLHTADRKAKRDAAKAASEAKRTQ